MTVTRPGLVFPLLFLLNSLSLAQTLPDTSAPGDSGHRFGIIFDAQGASHLSSPSSYAGGGYTFSLGFGLNFSPLFQMTVQIYTGRESIPAGYEKPVDGYLPLGGASLEATFFFASGPAVRPYASAGYGLYTLNGVDGYNGGGPHLEGGAEWDFSRYVSIRGGIQFGVIRYHDPTGEAYQATGFVPFTFRYAGAALRLAFYPTVLP